MGSKKKTNNFDSFDQTIGRISTQLLTIQTLWLSIATDMMKLKREREALKQKGKA